MGTAGVRATAAALLLCAGLLSGCAEDAAPAGADPPSTTPVDATATPSASGSATSVTDNAVEPPGPLEDRLYRPDMLIFSREQLSESMVEQVRSLPQVAAVERIGLAQVTIENRALTVAAVDAGTYRRFAPAASAETRTSGTGSPAARSRCPRGWPSGCRTRTASSPSAAATTPP
jgi:hypothetical protein